MGTSIEHQMTELYCFVDEFLKTPPGLAPWRRAPHVQPHFSEAEGLTIAVWQGAFEVATLKQTYRLVAQNWRTAFPQLPSDKQGLTRVHHLLPQVGGLLATPCTHTWQALHLYMIDSKPIPLCQPIRHGRVRLRREDGAYLGKTSKGGFFGFKLHLLRHLDGRVLNIVLPPGTCDARGPALVLVQGLEGGVTLGALGYRGPEGAADLAEEAALWLMTRDQAPAHRFVLSQLRQHVETTFSQLWRKFVDRVFSRSWTGLWNTLQLKVLYYNLCHAGVLST